MAALIQHGGQQPLLPPAILPSTLATSIPSPAPSWSSSLTPATASSTAIPVPLVSSYNNDSSLLKSPFPGDNELRCPSYFSISSISDYVSAWAALIWHVLTFGVFGASKTEAPERTSRVWTNRPPLSRNTTFNPLQSDDDAKLREIPRYILDYAPYCWLFSEEEYWPGLMEEHLENTIPFHDYEPVPKEYQNPDIHDLDRLNKVGGHDIYLTSKDDPESYPDWLGGQDNIPEATKSKAPVVLIVVDKGSFVDAFWFFFYSFNLGNQVLGVRFGNHVADWEHTMIRFRNGKPTEVFYSEHEWGAGYRWEDADKRGKRMYTYSAFGTHAMYRTAGIHRYVLPFGLLQDITDRGVLWDPLLNMYAYTYDNKTRVIRASNLTPDAPEEWYYFKGQWGDKYYPMTDPRQYRFAGELHYVSGPTGPWDKNLGRDGPCQEGDEQSCMVQANVEEFDAMPRLLTPAEWERWRKRMESRKYHT